MTALLDAYSSTGAKLFFHQEAMNNLRNGKGQCVVTHVLATDICNHFCSYCSVGQRAGDVLPYDDIMAYLDILLRYSVRAVILSGGGNPILYKCKKTGKDFNDLVDGIHSRGLQIGCISNGYKLADFDGRKSWKMVRPETLDKLLWLRISMAGLDHEEQEVYVPDIDHSKTTLGFSYIAADIFDEPADPFHGKVSTPGDLITLDRSKCKATWWFKDRVPLLTEQIRGYVEKYRPQYVRMSQNCLEPHYVDERCDILQTMADAINPDVVFVQRKRPRAPNVCLIGFLHPVMATDGYIYPCDAVTIAAADVGYKAGVPNHKFDSPWRICHWRDIADIYENKIRSLIDPKKWCEGCLFNVQNDILEGVVNGTIDPIPPAVEPQHAFFV